jgi:Domain of unknown function (DUF4833)
MKLLTAILALGALPAAAPPPSEIPTAFAITKSSNRNQVHYAVAVDGECAPMGNAPVRPYWRMLERGPEATEPLEPREEQAFGIAAQHVDSHEVRLALRGLPARPIVVRTKRADGVCLAGANMAINGAEAHLTNIFVKQRLFGVAYVEVTGTTADGTQVRERITL